MSYEELIVYFTLIIVYCKSDKIQVNRGQSEGFLTWVCGEVRARSKGNRNSGQQRPGLVGSRGVSTPTCWHSSSQGV